MPTANPRLTITLQPTLAAQLRRLSQLTGNSQSALISELLDGSGPVFERMITVLEAVQAANEAARDSLKGGVSRDLHEAHERMERQLGLTLEFGEKTAADLVEVVEKIKRRKAKGGLARDARPAPASAVVTPSSNRGVRSDRKMAKTPTRSRT